jgi:hypothetical protein
MYLRTLSYCSSKATVPISVAMSSGSPSLIALVRSTSRAAKSS